MNLIIKSLFIISFSLLLIGCGGRSARIIGDPIDFTQQVERAELAALITSESIQLTNFDQDYRLGPGDVVNIQLVGRADVFGTEDGRGADITITNNPNITLPLIGSIRVHGKTASELSEDLKQAFGVYIVNPQPIVLIQNFNRNQIAVLGSVANAGKYPFEFGDTAIDGIFRAGGLSTGGRGGGTAPGRFMKIYREKIDPEVRYQLSMDQVIDLITEGNQIIPREEITIPIDDFIFNGVLEYNIPLKQNDIVYVPPAGTVIVQGRVNAPGVVFLGPSVQTATQIINDRGGLRFSADSRIEIVRNYPDGQTSAYFMNIREMLSRKSEDFVVKDGDQIFIYPNFPRSVGETIGKLFQGGIKAGANATYSPTGP